MKLTPKLARDLLRKIADEETRVVVSHSTSERAFGEIMEERFLHPPSNSKRAEANRNIFVPEGCPHIFLSALPMSFLNDCWGDVTLFLGIDFVRNNASLFSHHLDSSSLSPNNPIIKSSLTFINKLRIPPLSDAGRYRRAFLQLLYRGSIPTYHIALVVVKDGMEDKELFRTSIPTLSVSQYKRFLSLI